MDTYQTIDMLLEENQRLKQKLSRVTKANEFNLKYRDLVNSLGEIVLVAQDNKIVYGNRKLEERFGLSLEEISSVPFTHFIHEDDHEMVMDNHKKRMADQDFSGTYPFRIFNVNQEYRWIKVSAVHILWHDRPATLNILTDIHEQVIAEIELVKAKKRAEQSAQSKDQFLAKMNHEIRTPMNDVLGVTQLLLETHVNETQEHYLTTIENSSQYLLRVINNILDFSSIESNKIAINSETVDIRNIITQLNNTYSYEAVSKELQFECKINSSIPQFIISDQKILTQILTNLLSNAITFTKKGSVQLAVTSSSDKQSIIFAIKDTGIGIPESIQKNIFEPFSQINSIESRQEEGMGLELSLSKQLATIISGTLTCESRCGTGSTFTLQIPLQKAVQKQNSKAIPRSTQKYGFNVHIVEDNDTNYFVIEKFLNKLGCSSTRSVDGYDAIIEIEKNSYDMIFMDIQLPGINGYETTKMIRELSQGKDIPIIAMTANTMKQDEKRCFDAGMDYFLSKPIEFKKLPSVLEKFSPVI